MAAANLVLVHGTDWQSRAIELGTRSHWSHVAMTIDATRIVEALPGGVVVSLQSKYRDALVVDTGLADADRQRAVAYALSTLGERYDWLTIAGLALKAVTRDRITLGVEHEQICSVLVARALEHAGVSLLCDANDMSPGDLANFYGVKR